MEEVYRSIKPIQTSLIDLDEPALRFVVRRHHATNLHWDIRFEANRVLYSWFMKQLPTADPSKPVAAGLSGPHNPRWMFSERFIRPGNPGAGPTIVEDYGKARPLVKGYSSQDLAFHESFFKGRIPLFLDGQILQGAYVMERGIQGWQFRKLEDEAKTPMKLDWTCVSPISGRTLEDLIPADIIRIGRSWVFARSETSTHLGG